MSTLFHVCIKARGMLTVAHCTQAVVWIQVMGSHEHLSVEDQAHWVQGTLPIPRELLRILVVNANRSPPTHGMYYSSHSSACIQVMGAGRNVFAVRARLEMQGTSMAARVMHGVYAEVRHMTNSIAQLSFVAHGCHIANEETLVVHNSEASMALLFLAACMGWCNVLASQEVLLVCSVLKVPADARAMEALSGWKVGD